MTTFADIEHVSTEAFDAMSSGARYAAPKAVGFFGRVLRFGAKEVADVAPSLESEAVALVPGMGELSIAWKIASNPFVHLLAAIVLILAAYGVGHWLGYDRGYTVEERKIAVASATARADAEAKAARQAEVAASAKRDADARIASLTAQRDRANAKLAAMPPTRKCPSAMMDAIHSVGAKP